MKTQTIKQNLVYIGIAVIVFLLLSMVRPAHSFKVTGIILPATQTPLMPGTSEPIQVFYALPLTATPLAYINLESHSLKRSPEQEKIMMDTANQMAQKIGANGLVLNRFDYEPPAADNPAPLAKYALFAIAIKTRPQSDRVFPNLISLRAN